VPIFSTSARAGVPEALTEHVLPGFQTFAVQARALAVNATADCTAAGVRPSFHNTFDAWMGVSHLGFGPLDTDGRGLAIAFWPDKRGMVGSTVAALLRNEDSAVGNADQFSEVSVAGRGLMALERLLFDPDYAEYGRDSYTCRLVQALAVDLSRMAAATTADWQEQARLMQTAGQAGNVVYLSEDEPAQQLYTALLSGLEWTADQRLGRPMGSFERPRPERAEARRSGRSLRNVLLNLRALEHLAEALAEGPLPVSEAAFTDAIIQAEDLDDPVFAGVADPSGRLKVEILQQRVRAAQEAAKVEIGRQLGVSVGFNSADGD